MPSRAPLTCAPAEATSVAEKSRVATVAVASERHLGYRTAVVVRFLILTSNRRPPVSVPRAIAPRHSVNTPMQAFAYGLRDSGISGPPGGRGAGIGSTHA